MRKVTELVGKAAHFLRIRLEQDHARRRSACAMLLSRLPAANCVRERVRGFYNSCGSHQALRVPQRYISSGVT
jgi:hypothetical protein